MITATGLELRAGARILLEPTTLRVQKGDRIGLVGRNGAGKTTSLRVLAGESLPHAGAVDRTGPVGYLPQDPRTGDLDMTARDRVLSARGLDVLASDIAKIQVRLAETPDDEKLIAPLRQPRGALHRARRVRGRERGGAHLREPRAARPRARADRSARCPAASAAASNWRGSCSPTRRGSRPRCCSTSRPTTSTPTRSPGCATSCASTTAA